MTDHWIWIYLALINIVTFAAFGSDKHRAKTRQWRIPESRLLLLSLLGGSAGAFLGMLMFHHKTRKARFMVLVPLFLAAQGLLLYRYLHT